MKLKNRALGALAGVLAFAVRIPTIVTGHSGDRDRRGT
jgi:hypothetical protein